MRPFHGLASLPAGPPGYVYGTGAEARELLHVITRHPDHQRAEFVALEAQAVIDGVRVWTPETLRLAIGRTATVIIATPADDIDASARILAAQGFHNTFDPRPFWRRRLLEARLSPLSPSSWPEVISTAAEFVRLPSSCYVYGTGRGGRMVRAAVETAGRKVLGFVDSFRPGELDDLPVFDPAGLVAALARTPEPSGVVLASLHWGELETTLRGIGVIHIWDAYPYIAFLLARAARAPFPREALVLATSLP